VIIKKQINKEKKYLENNFIPNKNELLQKYKEIIHSPKKWGYSRNKQQCSRKTIFSHFFYNKLQLKKKRKKEKKKKDGDIRSKKKKTHCKNNSAHESW
jgi:RecG-like helicase